MKRAAESIIMKRGELVRRTDGTMLKDLPLPLLRLDALFQEVLLKQFMCEEQQLINQL
jgi:hypothetical protein